MTSEGYDKLIDALKLWTMRVLIIAGIFMFTWAIIATIAIIVVIIMKIEPIYMPFNIVNYSSILTTFLIYYPMYLYRKANKCWPGNKGLNEVKFRDLWISWATTIDYRIDSSTTMLGVTDWIRKNIQGLHRIHQAPGSASSYKCKFYFFKKSDAMAFKLAWEGANGISRN